jgi:hypothetical protein
MRNQRKLTFKNPHRYFWQVGLVFEEEICVGVDGRALFRIFGKMLWLVTIRFDVYVGINVVCSDGTVKSLDVYRQGDIKKKGEAI